jgi:hypothetical protein
MVCPVYVALLIDESESWGLKLRRAPSHGRERTLKKCGAPHDFLCFHKGTLEERGVRRCYSPDGFTTEVAESDKIKLIIIDNEIVGADKNDKFTCPYIEIYRRPSVQKSGLRARRRGSNGSNPSVASFNEMPAATDPRKQAVFTELWGRITYLKERKLPVTADTVAALAGHAAWKDRDIHAD